MKPFKRIAIIIAAAISLMIIANGIYLSQLGKTVDCSGVVVSVDYENKIIEIIDDFDVGYTLKIKFYTSLKDINNKRISINKIDIGDIVTANFLGEWKNSKNALNAAYIRVAK